MWGFFPLGSLLWRARADSDLTPSPCLPANPSQAGTARPKPRSFAGPTGTRWGTAACVGTGCVSQLRVAIGSPVQMFVPGPVLVIPLLAIPLGWCAAPAPCGQGARGRVLSLGVTRGGCWHSRASPGSPPRPAPLYNTAARCGQCLEQFDPIQVRVAPVPRCCRLSPCCSIRCPWSSLALSSWGRRWQQSLPKDCLHPEGPLGGLSS